MSNLSLNATHPQPLAPAAVSPAPASLRPILSARGLCKTYRKGQALLPVLQGAQLDIHPGEFISIVGRSGTGKSTLMHLLGLLDAPDAGEVWFAGARVDQLPARRQDRLRNTAFGMIFQFYHLLPEFNTLENVLAPLMIGQNAWAYWRQRRQHADRARELLESVGLGQRLHHRPRELSGGEMQRTAIARALINRPQVLLADEPTGNLDRGTGWGIIDLLRSLNRASGLAIVMITHDREIARQADRTLILDEGLLNPEPAANHVAA